MIGVAIETEICNGIYWLDCYVGRCIRQKFSPTITTRTAEEANNFILEVSDGKNND